MVVVVVQQLCLSVMVFYEISEVGVDRLVATIGSRKHVRALCWFFTCGCCLRGKTLTELTISKDRKAHFREKKLCCGGTVEREVCGVKAAVLKLCLGNGTGRRRRAFVFPVLVLDSGEEEVLPGVGSKRHAETVRTLASEINVIVGNSNGGRDTPEFGEEPVSPQPMSMPRPPSRGNFRESGTMESWTGGDPAGEFEQAQLAFFASWVSHDPFVIARELRKQFHEVGARGSVISIHEGRALTVDLSPAYPQGNEIFKRAVAEILADDVDHAVVFPSDQPNKVVIPWEVLHNSMVFGGAYKKAYIRSKMEALKAAGVDTSADALMEQQLSDLCSWVEAEVMPQLRSELPGADLQRMETMPYGDPSTDRQVVEEEEEDEEEEAEEVCCEGGQDSGPIVVEPATRL